MGSLQMGHGRVRVDGEEGRLRGPGAVRSGLLGAELRGEREGEDGGLLEVWLLGSGFPGAELKVARVSLPVLLPWVRLFSGCLNTGFFAAASA